MNINKIIDNGGVTDKIKSIYKSLDKHKEDIKSIFDLIHDDLRSIFSDVIYSSDCISVTIQDSSSIGSVKDMVDNIVVKHTKETLSENYVPYISYIFKTAIIENTVNIYIR